MLSKSQSVNINPAKNYSVHDSNVLQKARFLLDSCQTFEEMGEQVKKSVARNAKWRGNECINLLAPEAPSSPKTGMVNYFLMVHIN